MLPVHEVHASHAVEMEVSETEPMQGTESMDEQDHDSLLAVRLALMRGHTATLTDPLRQLQTEVGDSSVFLQKRHSNTDSQDEEPQDAPDMRAHLLGSVRLELMRGLAAASHNGGATATLGSQVEPPWFDGRQHGGLGF